MATYKRIYQKLFDKIKQCSMLKVPLTHEDMEKFKAIFEKNPQMFYKNATKYYFLNLRKSVREGKVWRNNISGPVRHGKSEVAQVGSMIYIDEFNQALSDGCFDFHKEQGIEYQKGILKPLKASINILFSQSNYLYDLREKQKENKLIYGFMRIVDEDQDSIGGIGSYSERIELTNVNNVTAQSLQAEYQLRPDRFVLQSARFGLHQEKMDRKNRINWSMLYERNTDPLRTEEYIFKGWVAFPLHDDEELRKEYNMLKKENINKVYEGTADLRMLERVKVAKSLSDDENFASRNVSGKTFKYSKGQQKSILTDWIIEKKCQNFNEMEQLEIIEHARMLAEKKYTESLMSQTVVLKKVTKKSKSKKSLCNEVENETNEQ